MPTDSEKTVRDFAQELHESVETLLEQLKSAGISQVDPEVGLSKKDKRLLVRYLVRTHLQNRS
jgi:translation initiation factor IF-2